ncbi:class I SAM-dependent methyltransferase [Dyella jejuensis]|uniref:Class I SAM-dependent methyltransferase n=1 Tax=Dyella jejuensis TaxID=1432009 RepID=A0ABW8JLK2_9GAMM
MNELLAPAAGLKESSASTFDRFLRDRLLERMRGIRHGTLTIHDAWGTVQLGDVTDTHASLHVNVRVDDAAFYRAIAGHGSVGAGDAYGNGHWRCDNLVALVRLLVRNRSLLDGMETGMARAGGALLKLWHALRRNTREGSRRNIAEHYDLGNTFFATFLSDDMMYSSALWTDDDDTLQSASTRKLDTICHKLDLRPGQRLMEIGTGWGGFAIHAARHYGCHVTTTTLSREQHALATQRIAEAGLSDKISVLLKDYRDLDGQYDRVVSIEMIEAIGAPYLETYFAKLTELLAPDGIALIQAITIEDHRYTQALRSVDFIKRHIFPGSFIPSISAMLAAKARASDLALIDLEDFGRSYARTLHAWRERFLAAAPEIRAQGFDEPFMRLWEFYLAYCEGGFLERSIGVAHLLFARPAAQPAGARWTPRAGAACE